MLESWIELWVELKWNIDGWIESWIEFRRNEHLEKLNLNWIQTLCLNLNWVVNPKTLNRYISDIYTSMCNNHSTVMHRDIRPCYGNNCQIHHWYHCFPHRNIKKITRRVLNWVEFLFTVYAGSVRVELLQHTIGSMGGCWRVQRYCPSRRSQTIRDKTDGRLWSQKSKKYKLLLHTKSISCGLCSTCISFQFQFTDELSISYL